VSAGSSEGERLEFSEGTASSRQGGHRRIAVLGGGISGLAAAYQLAKARRAGDPIQEFLIEASPRLGGVILTERAEGFLMEAGPDSFLTEKPQAAALCRELGLADSLIGSNDAGRRTYVLHSGRLVPLPDGLMLMVPTRLGPVLQSPLVPFSSLIAMARDWFAGPRAAGSPNEDESVASFVRRHFGSAILENIADPLLAGVYGGDAERLSMRAVLPRFWEMEKKNGSLIRATLKARKEILRRRALRRGGGGSEHAAPALFTALSDGLERMVEKLGEQLDAAAVHLRCRVASLEAPKNENGCYRISCNGGVGFEAESVVMALPARESARLLAPVDAELSQTLESFEYTSAVTVALAYDKAAIRSLPAGFGFLVPRKENRRLLACTFVHQKFPSRAPEGKGLLRCFLGGAKDPEAVRLSDKEILAITLGELRSIMKLDRAPLFHRIYRWPGAMPQYVVGHAERIARIRQRLECRRNLFLCGNAFEGIGISDSIRTGTEAAARALA
jgi:protoporphyrinogen/coproporphyrinogen III oxidase